MRKYLVLLWLLPPVAALAYHYGPGQENVLYEKIELKLFGAEMHAAKGDEHAEKARALLQKEDLEGADEEDVASWDEWEKALPLYAEAQEMVPDEDVSLNRRLTLASCKGMSMLGQLESANQGLDLLMRQLEDDPEEDPVLSADVRSALANTQFYLTWVLRLEGAPEEEWRPLVEASRQNYRLLMNEVKKAGDSKRESRVREDLDSVCRLAQMDLAELQLLPLPSKAKARKQGRGKGKGKGKKKGKGKGAGKGKGKGKMPGKGPGKKGPPDGRGAGGKVNIDQGGS